jgi:hypothetical protein
MSFLYAVRESFKRAAKSSLIGQGGWSQVYRGTSQGNRIWISSSIPIDPENGSSPASICYPERSLVRKQ